MAEDADSDQKTEQPTAKRQSEAVEKGDVLQSRELGTALVVLAGAGWLALAGPWMMTSLQTMLQNALMFDVGAVMDALTAVRGSRDGTAAEPMTKQPSADRP